MFKLINKALVMNQILCAYFRSVCTHVKKEVQALCTTKPKKEVHQTYFQSATFVHQALNILHKF